MIVLSQVVLRLLLRERFERTVVRPSRRVPGSRRDHICRQFASGSLSSAHVFLSFAYAETVEMKM